MDVSDHKIDFIKSISGIRGTIGGKPGESLSPIDVVKFSAAYGTWILKTQLSEEDSQTVSVVIGRDARPTGGYITDLVFKKLYPKFFKYKVI